MPRPPTTPTRRPTGSDQGWQGYKLHPPRAPWVDAPAPPVAFDIEACAAVRSAVGPEMTLMLDSSWSYSYSGGAARRPRDRGTRLRVVRGPARGARHPRLPAAQALPAHPDPRHRDDARRPAHAGAVDHRRRHRLPAWRRRHQGRDHRHDEDRPPRRGLRHELRDPRRLQRDEQRREPERRDGDRQLRLVRDPRLQPLRRARAGAPELRPGASRSSSTPTAISPRRPAPGSASASIGN